MTKSRWLGAALSLVGIGLGVWSLTMPGSNTFSIGTAILAILISSAGLVGNLLP